LFFRYVRSVLGMRESCDLLLAIQARAAFREFSLTFFFGSLRVSVEVIAGWSGTTQKHSERAKCLNRRHKKTARGFAKPLRARGRSRGFESLPLRQTFFQLLPAKRVASHPLRLRLEFRITLRQPLSERDLLAPVSTVSPPGEKKRRMSLRAGDVVRKTVLIVDDSVFVRRALCELFKRQPDFDVCGVAENGREAIEVASRLHPDLIVLDLSMPVMNGLDAARVLKRVLPTVPLMMYSAFEDRLSEKQAKMIGISEIVSKIGPVSLLLEKARALAFRTAA
jgi:two-component system, chemotaxis family, chemotaxis protein CheY